VIQIVNGVHPIHLSQSIGLHHKHQRNKGNHHHTQTSSSSSTQIMTSSSTYFPSIFVGNDTDLGMIINSSNDDPTNPSSISPKFQSSFDPTIEENQDYENTLHLIFGENGSGKVCHTRKNCILIFIFVFV